MLVAVSLIYLMGLLAPDILTIGQDTFQTSVVLAFYLYCIISLFTASKHKLFHVLSIPVFTQFIQIFQKYDFPGGANSIWRLIPFIILDVYLINFLFHHQAKPQSHQGILLLWILSNTLFLIISPNFANIYLGGFILYLITIPLVLIYLDIVAEAIDFRQELEKYLCLIFIILGAGTLALIVVSAGYRGSDNLLVTRNIADTNITMAYFILLWPFSILYCIHNRTSIVFNIGLLATFIAVIVLSFSRGAILLVIPYIGITCVLAARFIPYPVLCLPIILSLLFRKNLLNFIQSQDLLYFWQLRFTDIGSSFPFLEHLENISGRTDIHEIAYDLFLQKPILGHGIGSFEILGPGYREAHSLWYTLLAEQGILGIIFIYCLFFILIQSLIKYLHTRGAEYYTLFLSILFFLLFNHTVGSTFVILPSKSVTVNCIAPILLICTYFYTGSFERIYYRAQPNAAL